MIRKHTSLSIDVIRGAAALGVIWGHSVYGLGWPIELNGAFWVWIFLVVSGYLVGESLSPDRYGLTSKGFFRFLWNRALRIVPLYEVALLLGLALSFWGASGVRSWVGVARQFTFTSPLNKVDLCGPLWTIVTEIHFYLLSGLVVWLVTRQRNKAMLLLSFAVSVAVASWFVSSTGDNAAQPRTFFGNLPYFVFGIALSTGSFDIPSPIQRWAKSAGVLLLVGLAWFLNNWHADYFWGLGALSRRFTALAGIPLGGASVCALLIGVLVLCTQVKEGGPPWLPAAGFHFVLGILAWCGFYTYGIYIWHAVLAMADQIFFHIPTGFFHWMFLLLALPLAFWSYKWVESPLLRFKLRAH